MPEAEGTLHEHHFESLERQREAARLGMWVFLASETLLFAALFALYAAQRSSYLSAFEAGIRHNETTAGAIMTFVLLFGSFTVAWAVHEARDDRPRVAGWLVGGTALSGVAFVGLKLWEYGKHVHEGMVPGGSTHFYEQHGVEGITQFVNLYWITTGLHLLHVLIGVALMLWFAQALFRGALRAHQSHRLANAALFWHMVDAVWIFLWPMFYLMGRVGG